VSTRVRLEKEMETLLIPLYGRMRMTRAGVCDDPYAERTVARDRLRFCQIEDCRQGAGAQGRAQPDF
jgi:O-methyltransferase involved in polyketide biosynthesis